MGVSIAGGPSAGAGGANEGSWYTGESTGELGRAAIDSLTHAVYLGHPVGGARVQTGILSHWTRNFCGNLKVLFNQKGAIMPFAVSDDAPHPRVWLPGDETVMSK